MITFVPYGRVILFSNCKYHLSLFLCSPIYLPAVSSVPRCSDFHLSFHLSPRVSHPLLNKVSVGVIGPKFALTNRAGCCNSAAAALFRMIQLQVGGCLPLSHACVCVFFPLHASYFPATSHTRTFLHIAKCAWRINAFGNINTAAAAPAKDYSICNSSPNENSCYITNSQGDVGCLAITRSSLTLRCQIQIHFSKYIWKYLRSKRMHLIQLCSFCSLIEQLHYSDRLVSRFCANEKWQMSVKHTWAKFLHAWQVKSTIGFPKEIHTRHWFWILAWG